MNPALAVAGDSGEKLRSHGQKTGQNRTIVPRRVEQPTALSLAGHFCPLVPRYGMYTPSSTAL